MPTWITITLVVSVVMVAWDVAGYLYQRREWTR